MANRATSLTAAVFVPIVVGAIGLFNLMKRPGFQDFHNVDILQLLVSGMCFGVALTALIVILRGLRAEKR
jgi:hypothetical protein